MNNRGMALGTKVILVIVLLLIVFIAVAGSFGFGFKKVFDQAKQLLGFPSEQLEELREITAKPPSEAQEIKEVEKNVRKFLVDAAKLIRTGSSTNVKNYDDAVKKYVGYYKDCEKWKWVSVNPCGTIGKGGVKFRILNALREKYFVKPDQDINQDDIKTVPKDLITQEEFNCAITLIKVVAYTNSGNRNKVFESHENYDKCEKFGEYFYYMDDFFSFRYLVLRIKDETLYKKDECEATLETSKELISFVDTKLGAFETASDEVDFDVLDYKFLKEPNDYIEKTCETL